MNPFTKGKVASRTSNAELTETEVRQIRKMAKEGVSPKNLSDIYGIGIETIRRIIRRETWRWVADELDLEAPIGQITPQDRAAADESARRLAGLIKPLVEDPGMTKLAAAADKLKESHQLVDQTIDELTREGGPYDFVQRKEK